MCGIGGICRLVPGKFGEDASSTESMAVSAMMDKMIHRGPDGSGIWNNGRVCLGHRRLSIIDLAGGSQPMTNAEGNLCIVFNGEIYNFQSLRRELENSGAKFRTDCDTEVILAAYERWQDKCLDYLEGMFAFALWDNDRERLFCARDHFGKKPFYYTAQNGLFAFASELSALTHLARRLPYFSFHLQPLALSRYLAYEYVPTPQCIYEEVKSLEPAHFLIVEKGNLKSGRYWDLPWPEQKMPASEPELCAKLYSLLKEAVARRMVSDVPLGVFLSGGIDSTIVAGLMASQSSRPVQTFSIGFKEASYDESRYARIAARYYQTDHHERILSAEECADRLPEIVSKMDTPMADASCAPTWLLSSLARENVTVALGGDGADELWAGYEHYIGFRLALGFNGLPGCLKKILYKLPAILPTSAAYINPRLAVKTFLKGASAPDWLRVQTMLTAMDIPMQQEILSRTWLRAHDQQGAILSRDVLFAPTREQYEHWQGNPGPTPLARAFHVYVRQFMLDDILVKVDRCSMLHSLEVRAPFLDKRVAEFAGRLPVNCKLRGFKRKYLLKKAFAQLLPAEILHRNKRGFQIPVAQWLRGKLKPLLLELCSPERLREQGIFDPKAVNNLLQRHISGQEDLRKPLWTMLVLQLWLKASGAEF